MNRSHSWARAIPAALLSLGTLPALAVAAPMMPAPSVSIVSPAAGATVTGADIPVTLATKNFNVGCAGSGKTATSPAQGHIHAMLDGMDMEHMTNMYCSDRFTISGQGLKPGKHTLSVVLATDAHVMDSLPTMVSFDYEPAQQPAPLPAPLTGAPAISIISPTNGATVGKKFNVEIAVTNFDLSCDLEGKPDVAGYGHVHIFATQSRETTQKPAAPLAAMMKTPAGTEMGKTLMHDTGMSMNEMQMMMTTAMPGMLGMPCTKTIPVDLSQWHDGQAKILIMLANNDHMPTPNVAPAAITVHLK
ncbi:hypothetical protein EPN44_02770 [bacterium]|nr:MAG: hypothetical protein EPN44_02770 [bacterium]